MHDLWCSDEHGRRERGEEEGALFFCPLDHLFAFYLGFEIEHKNPSSMTVQCILL
jgi:hypothetical protein